MCGVGVRGSRKGAVRKEKMEAGRRKQTNEEVERQGRTVGAG